MNKNDQFRDSIYDSKSHLADPENDTIEKTRIQPKVSDTVLHELFIYLYLICFRFVCF